MEWKYMYIVWNEKERRLMDRDWYGVERRMEQKSAWNRDQYRMEGRIKWNAEENRMTIRMEWKTLLDQ